MDLNLINMFQHLLFLLQIYIRLISLIIQLYLLPKLSHFNLQFSVKSFQISYILGFIIMSSGALR